MVSLSFIAKTAVSAVVSIGGVYRDVIVVRTADAMAVVDARSLEPVVGYSPSLPHYTQHAVYQMTKTAGWTGYNGRKETRLLAEASTVSPYYTARDLFAHSAHMLTVGKDPATPAEVKSFVKKLVASFKAQ